jgi:hypothetical protein
MSAMGPQLSVDAATQQCGRIHRFLCLWPAQYRTVASDPHPPGVVVAPSDL